MPESNDSRIEAEKCLRKANSCDNSQDRWAWRVLAESWLLLANIHETVENRNKNELALAQREGNTAQHRGALNTEVLTRAPD
jgi:hypothetical protein